MVKTVLLKHILFESFFRITVTDTLDHKKGKIVDAQPLTIMSCAKTNVILRNL
jgi:hypothetical protein